ncbi:YeeE/YedE family protein [Rhizobium alvei]|uniref:YeeE/YedE family protein n=1 Tax=Rhizobium alvei TaxID=1132659 RepID=A0ABT8YFP2_9HYPH|nr:YeeE/YedE family protein [Rhizobium alvei]MDO6962508.1 YeeE/YedE family protein [Rhizobium alvei]
MKYVSALLIGAVFGLGIAISGMANPAKVLNFFDLAGTWDPSLAFVMIGALAVAMPGYALVFRNRQKPTFEAAFDVPKNRSVDRRLLGGSALFGIGWGIAGFCPGGAIPALGLLDQETALFLIAMTAGIVATRYVLRAQRAATANL